MLQLLRETSEGYAAFVDEICNIMKEKMGQEYSIRVYTVTKNNNLELDSLVILKEGKSFSPNIYLLPYYEAYRQGVSMDELADRLYKSYNQSTMSIVSDNFSFSFHDLKSSIIYRVVSFERNDKLLERIPYIKYLDLAITFHCLVRDDEDGIGTIRITNEHMLSWKTSLQELYNLAVENTQRLFPSCISSMDEVIRGMLLEEHAQDNLSGDLLDEIIQGDKQSDKHRMYILTNKRSINGATCLLYDNVLHEFANSIQSDLFILPSSIHEVILVPYSENMSIESLTEMVKDVNRTQVAYDEVLSDRVYFYSRAHKGITM